MDLSHDHTRSVDHNDDALTLTRTSGGSSGRRDDAPAFAYMPLWLYWIVLGLIAGSLAKWILPGRDPAGCLFTILLGIGGAFLGGLIGSYVGWGQITQGELDLRSIGIATVGAIVVLIVGRLIRVVWRPS